MSGTGKGDDASPSGSESVPKDVSLLIYGLGSIGGALAFFLSRNPSVTVRAVARSNYDAVKDQTLSIDSHINGKHSFRLHSAYRSTREAAQAASYDYVICAQKVTNQDASAEDLRPVIGPHTTIVIAQNGVGNEDPYRAKYPHSTIISGSVWIGAEQITPGVFVTRTREEFYLGLFHNNNNDLHAEQRRLNTLAALLNNGGLSTTIEENVQAKKWEKLICNVLWNPVSTITQHDMGSSFFSTSAEAHAFSRALMLDVVKVGKAAGVPLDDSLADRYLTFTKGSVDFEPSMLRDYRMGNPLEIESIVEAPVRKAKELGLQVPTLTAVYVLIMALRSQTSRAQK